MAAPSAVAPGSLGLGVRADPRVDSTSATSARTRAPGFVRAGPQLIVGPERRRQDDPPRGDRPAGLGPLPPDVGRRRARPLGQRPRPGRGPRRPARRSRSRSSGPARRTGGPEADPGQRRRPAGGRARRAAPDRRLRPRGDAPRRRLAGSPARGDRPARDAALAGLRRTTSRPTAGRSSSGTASCVPSGRSRRRATSCGSGTRRSSTPAARSSPRGCGSSTTSPGRWRGPTPRSRRRRPAPARLGGEYVTNAPALPGESPRDALARRLVETAEKEVWNGSTLIGPHRDDLVFRMDGRDLAGVRVARPAADRDPRAQARRARPR